MCSNVIECLYNFQTLISGVLAILAALGTGIVIWKTAYLPIKHKKMEDEKQTERKRHYIALVLSRNFLQLATRAKQAQGTVTVTKAANASVTENVRKRVMLKFDPIIDDSELMSLFPADVLTAIVDLRKAVEEHNFNMEGAGGSFGDDNVGERIMRKLDSIQQKCRLLSNQLNTFNKEPENSKN
jgi:hypothetical protein